MAERQYDNIDLAELNKFKDKKNKNSFLCYLNKDSSRYKIVDLRHVLVQTELEIVAINETKLAEQFLDGHFLWMDILFLNISVTEISTVEALLFSPEKFL